MCEWTCGGREGGRYGICVYVCDMKHIDDV
jgi:hypothetical protein